MKESHKSGEEKILDLKQDQRQRFEFERNFIKRTAYYFIRGIDSLRKSNFEDMAAEEAARVSQIHT